MEGLLETPEPRDTDGIPAQLPGIQLTSDFDDMQVVQQQSVTEDNIVAAAMVNANLGPSQELGKITGVNTEDDDNDDANPCNAHIISDGDESNDDEYVEDGYAFVNENHAEDLGNNPYGILAENEEETENENASIQDDENNALAQESDYDESLSLTTHHARGGDPKDGDEDKGTTAGVRRSKRKRKKKYAQVIDFDNKKVQGADRVIHVQTHEK